MNVLVFGDPVLAARTIRVIGGRWIDLETCEIAPQGTLFVQAGTVMVTPPAWEPSEAVFALGATYEDPAWQAYLKRDVAAKRPRPHAFFLSGAAIQILNTLRRKSSFWESLARLQVRTWIEPQLRNWFHPRLRVLQVVTSLHVGGAERVCVELSTMQECVGIVCWGQPKRTPLAKPLWDLSRHPTEKKPEALLEFARKLHVDLLHTLLQRRMQSLRNTTHYLLRFTMSRRGGQAATSV
jgi:hypothetical protein